MTPDKTSHSDFTQTPPFRLNEWLVRPSRQRIEKDGNTVKLEPKAMQTLVCLASRPGEVFSRQELLESVWADTIVGDETLSRIISQLRQLLDDDKKNPRFIETIYKSGYRLLAEPRPIEKPIAKSRRRKPLLIGLSLILLLCLMGLTLRPDQSIDSATMKPQWRQIPVTSIAGYEFAPAISPQGDRVAFSWATDASPDAHIWLKDLATDSLQQVSRDSGQVYDMVWSPDGDQLAYAVAGQSHQLKTVSLVDGETKLLVEFARPILGLDWSPDGRCLAFGAAQIPGNLEEILIYDFAAATCTPFFKNPTDRSRSTQPVFSPDGRQLAYLRSRTGVGRIHLVSIDGTEDRTLPPSFGLTTGYDWTADGSALIIAHMVDDYGVLQRLDLETGELTTIPAHSSNAMHPSLNDKGDRLVFADGPFEISIWTLSGSEVMGEQLAKAPVNSTCLDGEPRFSPDGRSLAFVSNRSGSSEIWLCETLDAKPRRLTDLGDPYITRLHWAPDNRRLVASLHDGRHYYMLYLDIDGHHRLLRENEHNEVATCWSNDGQWIYFMCDGEGRVQTWRIRPDGSGASLVYDGNDRVIGESASGRDLILVKRKSQEILLHALDGTSTRRLLDPEITTGWHGQKMCGRHLLFVDRDQPLVTLGRLDIATSRIDTLARIQAQGILTFTMNAIDERIYFEMVDQSQADIVMLDLFQ
jgi:Tol biopolymer transport system component/DNA-binding winged helix-turn-helix (wHTH) protein